MTDEKPHGAAKPEPEYQAAAKPEPKHRKHSRLHKMLKIVFGIVGLVILVGSIVAKEAYRDEYKDSVDAIDSAESVFLLKRDTLKILGGLWQLSNPSKPRRYTVRFYIPAPVDSDINDYLESASRLVKKLPERDKLTQQIEMVRSQNERLTQEANKLYDHYSQNVTRYEYRVEVIFDNVPEELEFRKRIEPIWDQIREIEKSFSTLEKLLVNEADKQKDVEKEQYEIWRQRAFVLTFLGAIVTLIAILWDIEGVEAIG